MTGPTKVEFLVGSEKRFFDFMAKLDKKDKIVIASHTDLDGVAAAKVINAVVDANKMEFLDYPDLNEDFVSKLKRYKATKVIFADLSFDRPEFIQEIEKFAEILIIDHHLFERDLNSERTVFMSASGYCASYIAYYLFSKMQNISDLDWLVAASSLSDFCYNKNKDWIKATCEKYGETMDFESSSMVNKIYDLAVKMSLMLVYFRGKVGEAYKMIGDDIESLRNIDNYAKDVQNEVKLSIEKFEKEKRTFGDVYYWEFAPEFYIKSIMINQLSRVHPHRTLIIAEYNGTHYEISARRHDGALNLVEIMKDLTKGFERCSAGGHIAAAGAAFPLKYIGDFRQRVQKLG